MTASKFAAVLISLFLSACALTPPKPYRAYADTDFPNSSSAVVSTLSPLSQSTILSANGMECKKECSNTLVRVKPGRVEVSLRFPFARPDAGGKMYRSFDPIQVVIENAKAKHVYVLHPDFKYPLGFKIEEIGPEKPYAVGIGLPGVNYQETPIDFSPSTNK